jgi:hypothetical protein
VAGQLRKTRAAKAGLLGGGAMRDDQRRGHAAEPITHYTVLATVEAAYMLPRDVRASTVARITNIWLP